MKVWWITLSLVILDAYAITISAWSGQASDTAEPKFSSLFRRTNSPKPGPSVKSPIKAPTTSTRSQSDVLISSIGFSNSGQSKPDRSAKVNNLSRSPSTSQKLGAPGTTSAPSSSRGQGATTQDERFHKESSPGLFRTFAHPPIGHVCYNDMDPEIAKGLKAAKKAARMDRERIKRRTRAAQRKEETGYTKPASHRMRQAIRRGAVKDEREWFEKEAKRQRIKTAGAATRSQDHVRAESPPSHVTAGSPSSVHRPDSPPLHHQYLQSLAHTENVLTMTKTLYSETLAGAWRENLPFPDRAQQIHELAKTENTISHAQNLYSQAQHKLRHYLLVWIASPDLLHESIT